MSNYKAQELDFTQPQTGSTRLVQHLCKHCGHPSGHNYFEYHRSYNSNMALALMLLLKANTTGFVHMEDLILSNGYKRCGDFSYLTVYNHIEKMEGERPDGSKKNGMYRIRPAGIAFAEGRTTVRKKFIMVEGEFIGYEGKLIDIREALTDKFKYSELMNKEVIIK